MKSPLIVLGLLCVVIATPLSESVAQPPAVKYDIELTTARKGYDGKTCWVHARAGTIPPKSAGNATEVPIVVMTAQKLLLTGSDVFYGLNEFRTDDLGKTWSPPREHATLSRRKVTDDWDVVPCDFTPMWHRQTGKLLGTGATFTYSKQTNAVTEEAGSRIAYSVYNPAERTWLEWKTVELPDDPTFGYVRAGCTQRYDLPNGEILLPIYSSPTTNKLLGSQVVRCKFDGETLTVQEFGNRLSFPKGRGFAEPSLTKCGDWFYLTLRNDDFAAVARSKDGLHFEEPKAWTFDDGKELGSYNTQAHWVTHADGLFLVYTRKGANNDHVFRHRAPLFIAQVDPENMTVLRKTERILVPQRGARLGNFGVTNVSEAETWITVTEWMQTNGPNYIIPVDNKYGSDNSLFVAKIRWAMPNKLDE